MSDDVMEPHENSRLVWEDNEMESIVQGDFAVPQPEGDGSVYEADVEYDHKLYMTISSIVGIERKEQFEGRDLAANRLGMAKRFSRMLSELPKEEQDYWQMHLKKMRMKEGLKTTTDANEVVAEPVGDMEAEYQKETF